MSHFYDPWTHAVNLFLTRVIQFVLLTLAVGLAIWAELLRWYVAATWKEVFRWTWDMVFRGIGEEPWPLCLGLCLGLGAALAACLFIWLMMRDRLKSGDHYQRGARTIQVERN